MFEDVGQWKRAWHFLPRAGEDMHAAVNRECVTVRQTVGLFDASTLARSIWSAGRRRSGGTDVHQPWYIAPGRCRLAGPMLKRGRLHL